MLQQTFAKFTMSSKCNGFDDQVGSHQASALAVAVGRFLAAICVEAFRQPLLPLRAAGSDLDVVCELWPNQHKEIQDPSSISRRATKSVGSSSGELQDALAPVRWGRNS